MIINHNLQAMNAHRQLSINTSTQAKSTEKLSSGKRINRAGDDAAGLAISEKMRAQINGLDQASRNAQDGISLIQTAEGSMDEVHSMLQRMRTLAVQSSTDTNDDSVDRDALQKEVASLQSEIQAVATRTEFNGMNVLDGTYKGKTFQIGANEDQTIAVTISDLTATVKDALDADISTKGDAEDAITAINTSINSLSTERAKLGAIQNRLEHTVNNLNNSSENLQSAESRVRDTDMAKEMMNFTKNNVLSQAAQSMIAQANQLPNQVLTLLR